MSMNQHVYVGPYLKIRSYPDRKTFDKVIIDELNESFYRPNDLDTVESKTKVKICYLLINHYRDRPRSFNLQNEDTYIQENVSSSKELSWFQTSFKKDIETIQKSFGMAQVEINWGVVSHYM